MRSTKNDARHRERGAALILTVVVIMILTTLGLTMATFTITEERTATTYRDSQQTRAIAESGVRIVQEMFRTPDDNQLVPLYSSTAVADDPNSTVPNWDYWGASESDVETELNEVGIWRAARAGASPARYTGSSNRFFKGPFEDTWAQTFGGTYSQIVASDQYDLKFNCTNPTTNVAIANSSTKCWLDTKINALLLTDADWRLNSGKITDISFYAPPTAGGRAYGLTTVRVTAVKYDGTNVIARETLEAVIIDIGARPAVLADGNMKFVTNGQGAFCGDGCEQVHANGNAEVSSNVSGGETPIVTATGTVTGPAAANKKDAASAVTAPHINPWDLMYKPTATTELDQYYLVAGRALDPLWTNGNPDDNPASQRKCGLGLLADCQDYNLEYTTAGVAQPLKTTADAPVMYKWDNDGQGWTTTGCVSTAAVVSCVGGPSFTINKVNDTAAPAAGTNTDTATLPFNIYRIPKTTFTVGTKVDGSTVLIDGKFNKATGGGSADPVMSIISVGSMTFSSNTEWKPALSNRAMWITGRDIDLQSNCCTSANQCTNNLTAPDYAGIIAAHEQIFSQSQTAILGIIIAEDRVNYDDVVDSTYALQATKGDHAYLCDNPSWPWTVPVVPGIASLKTATR